MTFSPTPEQRTILTAATTTKDNLLIEALAGAAKTSTLVLIAQELNSRMLCLAFNNRIAKEMADRLPLNCEAKTLHSLGFASWRDASSHRVNLNKDKMREIVKLIVDELPRGDAADFFENPSDTYRLIGFAKACGVHDEHGLLTTEEFFDRCELAPTEVEEHICREALTLSWKWAMGHGPRTPRANATQSIIDFDDMVYIPTLSRMASFPQFPIILIDEAQDLSALNHAMLSKLARSARVIAVGDSCQAIYGFRGAHENSMALLRDRFSMTRLALTVSFRCPRAIVREAHWRAPEMKYPEWAVEGEVRHLAPWTLDDLPRGAAIICRNNAPLFRLAIRLLRARRPATLYGNDIGAQLRSQLRKFSKKDLPQAEVLEKIEEWRKDRLSRLRSPRGAAGVNDRADCLRIFAEATKTLDEAVVYMDSILKAEGSLLLMTGHKSKGLEFDDVFFLDEDLIGTEHQEPNLRYVIQTRAKQRLTYIETEALAS